MWHRLLNLEIDGTRIYGLDILRAFAILFVVYGHGISIIQSFIPIRFLQVFYFDGVSIFFVLSGFLIGRILLRIIDKYGTSFPSLLNFWIRRWFRTLPNYFLILILLLLANSIIQDVEVSEVWKYFLFVQNFSEPHPLFFPEAWSLSIEEWFYIFIPASLFLFINILKRKQIIALTIIIGTIVAIISVRYYRFMVLDIETSHIWDTEFRKQVITRLDSIMFGVLGAYFSHYYYEKWIKHRKHLLIFGIIVLLLYKVMPNLYLSGIYPLYHYVFSFALVAIGTLLLLPFLSTYENGSGFMYRALTTISLISYSMYLINLSIVKFIALPIIRYLSPIKLDSNILGNIFQYVLFWSITIIGSIFIYKYFEKPITELREKFRIQDK